MGILFLIALLLAWPTFGLSILAWAGFAVIRGINRVNKKVEAIDRRRDVASAIDPIFGGKYEEFFLALDIPKRPGQHFSSMNATQAGRHIMNYLAHNPTELTIFIQGLARWKTKGSDALCDPVTAADCENRYEPPRDCRRPFGLNYAAMGASSSTA